MDEREFIADMDRSDSEVKMTIQALETMCSNRGYMVVVSVMQIKEPPATASGGPERSEPWTFNNCLPLGPEANRCRSRFHDAFKRHISAHLHKVLTWAKTEAMFTEERKEEAKMAELLGKKKWYMLKIVHGDLAIVKYEDLSPRPADAQPAGRNPYTPWYVNKEHLHFNEAGEVTGAHVMAEHIREARERFYQLLNTKLGALPVKLET